MSDLAFLRSKQLFAGEEAQVENSQCLGCLWAAQTGARSRDLGYGCYSAATWGSPRMPAGLGCIPGELCAGSGASQVADTVLGSDMCTESPWLCRAGAELLPQGLMLWDAPAPSSVSGDPSTALGKVLPPGCHCSPVQLLLAPGEVYLHVPTGHQVASGAAATPSPNHSGKWRHTAVLQVSQQW